MKCHNLIFLAKAKQCITYTKKPLLSSSIQCVWAYYPVLAQHLIILCLIVSVTFQSAQTSRFNLSNAGIHNHWPLGIVGFHQCGEIAAVDSLYPLEVWLAVVGHVFGALLMYVQPTVCKQS